MQIDNKVKNLRTLSPDEFLSLEFNTLKADKRDVTNLKNAIVKRGWSFPVYVWKDNNYVIDGKGRKQALEELLKEGHEIKEIPVVDIEADSIEEAKQKVLEVSSQYGDVTKDSFEAFTESFDADFETFDLKGISEDDFIEPEEKDDEVPEVPEEPKSKLGDLYELGEHRVLCGDSTKIEDVERLMSGQKADMVFTDPPYRMEAEGGSNQWVGKSAAKVGESIKDIIDFEPAEWLNTLPLYFEKGMNAYIFCNKDLVPDYLNWARDNKYAFNILFWKKPNALPLGEQHRPDVEYLIVIRKNAIWNNGLSGVNYSKSLEFGRENSTPHPTMKPVELITNELQISSNKGGIVIDDFLGSGSTLIASEKTGRKCYGMELDPKYVDVIVQRYVDYTGNTKIKLNGEEIEWKTEKNQ